MRRGSLSRYRKMRDFSATPEPSGDPAPRKGAKKRAAAAPRKGAKKRAAAAPRKGAKKRAAATPAKSGALTYFIQRHDATRLHYDFRLELDGVLKSWAVPKGPSLVVGEKRLAVEVEDHPLAYGTFEGGIPQGHYGAGHVLGWDHGTWTPEGDPHDGLKKGRLHFTLDGEKLHGRFTLVRTNRQGGRKNQWLLMKSKDEHATPASAGEVTEGLPVPALADVTPQLATLSDALPDGDGWIYELKLDGYRALASLDQGEVRLVSRTHQEWTKKYAVISDALKTLPIQSAIFDGEICALDDDGKPSFQRLQNAGKQPGQLVYFIFDLLFVDGFDVRDRPLHTRKAMLGSILAKAKAPLSFVTHEEDGEALFALACKGRMEGVIAKRRDGVHVPRRTRDWLKVKCQQRQELVIVGFTAPKGSRAGIGALLLGVHDGGALRYAGKVGTGFDAKTLVQLEKRLAPLAVERAAAAGAPRLRDATWVEPSTVCEVTFTEWTAEGALRHPVFVALREDEPASAVVREVAAPARAKPRATKAKPRATKAKPRATKAKPPRPARAPTAARAAKRPRVAPGSHDAIVDGVRISHPDRVVDAISGLTKLELATYYSRVAPLLLPHLARRPVALVRCPEGDQAACFFQKQRMPGMPDAIHADRVGDQEVLWVDDRRGLVSLIQFGTVELHGWGSRLPHGDQPDWIVMDLDPDEALPFDTVADAALALRKLMGRLGLETFLKTTGGKGLHVVAPISPRDDFEHVKALTHALAQLMVEGDRELFTAVMAKKSRTNKIFVDYLRNGFGATAIMPYAVRARPGATVALPIAWRDAHKIDPRELTATTVPAILARRRTDPWAALSTLTQSLPVAPA